MPTVELMSWVADQKRWMKWYRGKMYSRSPRQLGTTPTKDASRRAANDWWNRKQAEIDAALGEAKKHPAHVVAHYEKAIEHHRLYAKWHRKYGDTKQAEASEGMMDWLQEALKTDNPPYPLAKYQEDPLGLSLHNRTYVKGEDWGVWQERFAQIRREEREEKAVPKENTIRAHIDDYLALRKAQAAAKQKLGSYETMRRRLDTLRSWVDPLAPIESLNEALWERYCGFLMQKVADGKMSSATMQGTQVVARAFIRSRWERRMIELPRNLNSRNLAANVPLKEIETFSIKEIDQLFAKASERKRLYLLLMLNLGAYPVDIAKLEQDEVDWKQGRIARKRSKTRDQSENVPKVNYLLWRETFELLKKHRSEHPELVLLNANGSPLWQYREKDGKICKISNVATAYFQLQTAIGLKKGQRKPLKSLRKTAASMLENHPEYGRYSEYFLGETPSSVTGKHYVKPSREQFDAAIRWLGKQFGIE